MARSSWPRSTMRPWCRWWCSSPRSSSYWRSWSLCRGGDPVDERGAGLRRRADARLGRTDHERGARHDAEAAAGQLARLGRVRPLATRLVVEIGRRAAGRAGGADGDRRTRQADRVSEQLAGGGVGGGQPGGLRDAGPGPSARCREHVCRPGGLRSAVADQHRRSGHDGVAVDCHGAAHRLVRRGVPPGRGSPEWGPRSTSRPTA